MPFYELTRVMQYTETLIVEADSKEDAEDYFSNGKDFEENHDYNTYDQHVHEITSEEYEEWM